MQPNPNVAEAASLLGDSSRAAMLTALMDDRFHTATELAYMAGIQPQTASFHLSKLAKAEWVIVEKHGRHRYYRMAGKEIAEVLESFLSLSRPPEIRSFKQSSQMKALRSGRTCYDHLAGDLGVKLTRALLEADYIEKKEKEYTVTTRGESFFTDFGLNLTQLRKKRRVFSRACLDWSERQHHLAGALGSGLTVQLLNLEWIERVPASRAVNVTEAGFAGFEDVFGIQL
ncbi:MAG TPA: winged helix-turn-helix domain-containing protein [Bacillales bacterium]